MKKIVLFCIAGLVASGAFFYFHHLRSSCLVTVYHPGRVEVWTEVYSVPSEELAEKLSTRLRGTPIAPSVFAAELEQMHASRVWEGNVYESKDFRLTPGKYFLIGLNHQDGVHLARIFDVEGRPLMLDLSKSYPLGNRDQGAKN